MGNFYAILSSKIYILQPSHECLTNYSYKLNVSMRVSRMIVAAALCLYVATAVISTPALAGLDQKISRSASSTQTVTGSKTRSGDVKPGTTKPASASTATAKKKKDRPGGRFWARIMSAFRDIHSAEKKPK